MSRLFALVVSVSIPVTAAAQTGTISGTVLLDGDSPAVKVLVPEGHPRLQNSMPINSEELLVESETKGIANVFVYLRRRPAGFTLPPPGGLIEDARLEIRDGVFAPHALIMRTNQSLHVTNQDFVPHDISIRFRPGADVSQTIARADNVGFRLPARRSPQTVPVAIRDDFLPHMEAWLLVLDHPFAALTSCDGKFEITDVPAGEHEIVLWHEAFGPVGKQKVIVQSDQRHVLETIRVPIDKRINRP